MWRSGLSAEIARLTTRQRSAKCGNKVNFEHHRGMESSFNCSYNYITNDIKSAFFSYTHTFEQH